jgi:hypothetical protein
LKIPAGRPKQRFKSMDRLCVSSWTGAHENFQAREYDAGASPTSSEPARRRRTTRKAPSTNFENTLKLLRDINEPLRRSALVKCKWTLSNLLSSSIGRGNL